jgi:hypothetical protein
MGEQTNSRLINALGWGTTGVTFLAAGWLVVAWLVRTANAG